MNSDNKQNRLITFFILYALFFMLYWQFFGSKQRAAAPPPVQKIVQEAQAKEAQGQDTHRSLGDRVKSYQAAHRLDPNALDPLAALEKVFARQKDEVSLIEVYRALAAHARDGGRPFFRLHGDEAHYRGH